MAVAGSRESMGPATQAGSTGLSLSLPHLNNGDNESSSSFRGSLGLISEIVDGNTLSKTLNSTYNLVLRNNNYLSQETW